MEKNSRQQDIGSRRCLRNNNGKPINQPFNYLIVQYDDVGNFDKKFEKFKRLVNNNMRIEYDHIFFIKSEMHSGVSTDNLIVDIVETHEHLAKGIKVEDIDWKELFVLAHRKYRMYIDYNINFYIYTKVDLDYMRFNETIATKIKESFVTANLSYLTPEEYDLNHI